MIRFLIIIITICIPILATAVEYDCTVEKKFESLYTESVYTYTSEQLKKHQFSVKVEESSERAFFFSMFMDPYGRFSYMRQI